MDQQAISAQEMVKASGIKGGLVVHVGNGDGAVTADSRRKSQVQVLYRPVKNPHYWVNNEDSLHFSASFSPP